MFRFFAHCFASLLDGEMELRFMFASLRPDTA